MPFPTDEHQIGEAESKLSVVLPQAYRRRLMASNGGEVEVDGETWCLHPVRDDSSRKRLGKTWDDIVRQTGEAREWSGFPPGAISIGDNGSGDRLVLVPSGDLPLVLAWWNHESRELSVVDGGVEAVFGQS